MKTTADFLDALRVKLNLPSDGRLAVYLGMHRQHMSRYRTQGHTFDDAMSMRVADILEIDPAYVMACMHAQREKNAKIKHQWQRIAEKMAVAAAVLVFVGAPIISADGISSNFNQLAFDDNIHYAKYTAAALILTVWQYWYVFLPLIAFLLWAFYPKIPRSKNN